ncbi:MAG TPA: DMT family transporter [Synechococcales cyanobacterium M55_K2018_004]|nr:DMT family transporter [Synechococcales cyanobacterium M55_K2018_004]
MVIAFVTSFRGELAALAAALIWAIASLLFMGLGRQLSPLMLNLIKSSIAIALILLTLFLQSKSLPQVGLWAIGLLLLSGAIGIGLGDTAYFGSINCLGARRALLLESLAPPMTAMLASVFLREQLKAIAWMGIVLTVLGVAWVIVERAPAGMLGQYRPQRGIGFGLMAALGQASGAVLSRAALADTSMPPLWSTLFRLLGGVLVLAIILMVQQHSWQEIKQLRSPRLLTLTIATAFLGTYLGIWLQQTALKYTQAGIAQALTSTSPLFVIPIAIAWGERVSVRAILGVLVAIGGVWLLFTQP